MKLESGWVPVALSSNIEKGTSAGAVVEGVELVVWRDNSGNAHVWEDRCPHRGMRLSFGFVRGDHIACLYHGWQYDTAGQCRYIPAHPDLEVPQTIKVPIHRTVEKSGIIWVTASEEAAPPDFGAASVTPLRSLYVDATARNLLTALAAHAFKPSSENTGSLTIEGKTVLVALQVAGPVRAAAHMVVAGEVDRAMLEQLSRWAQALRRQAESPDLTAEVA